MNIMFIIIDMVPASSGLVKPSEEHLSAGVTVPGSFRGGVS
jgi:hypothetical protein